MGNHDLEPSWLDNPLFPIKLYLAAIGLLALVDHSAPGAVAVTTPQWLTAAWAVAFVGGALLSVAGCLRRRNRVESAGLALLVAGFAVFALAETYAGWQLDDVLALLALTAACVLRMRTLHLSRKAVRVARRQVDGAGVRHA